MKRPIPGEWGRTMPLGEALKQGQIVVEPTGDVKRGEEASVQVARSAFIKTLLGNEGQPQGAPQAAQHPDPEAARTTARPVHGRPGGSFPVPGVSMSKQPEPLRDPSGRPAPTPYQTRAAAAQGQSRTVLMPGTPAAAQQPAPSAPERAATAAPAAGMAKKTLPLGAAAIKVDQLGSTRPPATSARQAPAPAPGTMPLSASAPRAAASPAPPRAPAQTEEPHYTGAEPVVLGGDQNVSQPLQLQLDASDELHDARLSGSNRIPRNRGPMIAGLVVMIALVAGAAAWFMRGQEPKPVTEPTRNEAVKAAEAVTPQPAPAAPVPAAPVAPAPAALPSAVQPTAPGAGPTTTAPGAVAAPQPAQPTPEAAAPKPAPKAQRATAPARRKPEPRASKKTRGASKAPAADLPEGVQEARDALRSLESGPVMKIQPSEEAESEGPAPEAPDPPPLPEPPVPPSGE